MSGYSAAHHRVRALRGDPSDYPCAGGCGNPGAEWSYAGPLPAPRVDPRGRPYSIEPRLYVARCRECHRLADRAESSTCRRGHLWSESNTYTRPDGGRECKACRRTRGESQ